MDSSTRRQWNQEETTNLSYFLGLGLAILSTIFIGSSFIIKKLALLRLNRKGALRAGAGGYGYLKDWMWWLGLITMGTGELANFAAYTFAPASLVTPLGALSVLVTAVLSSKFLNETLNALGKLGCLLCILGSTVLIIHSPKEQEVKSVDELLDKVHQTYFLHYVVFVVLVTVINGFYLGPRYGSRHVVVYISLCSAIGSLLVMACKGLGLAISETLSHGSDTSYSVACLFLAIVVVCVSIQMNFLNKALDLFNTSVVTPVYYVMFTSMVIVASAILFNEWGNVTFEDVLGSGCGFLVVIVAIFLMQNYRESRDFDDTKKYKCLLRNGYKSDHQSGVLYA